MPLIDAYCYETDSITPALIARSNRHHNNIRDHYYCTFEGCNVEVHPHISVKGNYFYAAERHGHRPNCDHFHQNHGDVGLGIPRGGEPMRQPLIIPTALRPVPHNYVRRREMEEPPTPQQIAEMIRNAGPEIIPGTLADVVDAWHDLSKEERQRHPLLVNGKWMTYENTFVLLRDEVTVISNHWVGHIVWGYVNIKPGDANGYYFLSTIRRLSLGGRGVPVEFIIRPKHNIEVNTGQRMNAYWYGGAPIIEEEKRYRLLAPNHGEQFLCLRAVD